MGGSSSKNDEAKESDEADQRGRSHRHVERARAINVEDNISASHLESVSSRPVSHHRRDTTPNNPPLRSILSNKTDNPSHNDNVALGIGQAGLRRLSIETHGAYNDTVTRPVTEHKRELTTSPLSKSQTNDSKTNYPKTKYPGTTNNREETLRSVLSNNADYPRSQKDDVAHGIRPAGLRRYLSETRVAYDDTVTRPVTHRKRELLITPSSKPETTDSMSKTKYPKTKYPGTITNREESLRSISSNEADNPSHKDNVALGIGQAGLRRFSSESRIAYNDSTTRPVTEHKRERMTSPSFESQTTNSTTKYPKTKYPGKTNFREERNEFVRDWLADLNEDLTDTQRKDRFKGSVVGKTKTTPMDVDVIQQLSHDYIPVPPNDRTTPNPITGKTRRNTQTRGNSTYKVPMNLKEISGDVPDKTKTAQPTEEKKSNKETVLPWSDWKSQKVAALSVSHTEIDPWALPSVISPGPERASSDLKGIGSKIQCEVTPATKVEYALPPPLQLVERRWITGKETFTVGDPVAQDEDITGIKVELKCTETENYEPVVNPIYQCQQNLEDGCSSEWLEDRRPAYDHRMHEAYSVKRDLKSSSQADDPALDHQPATAPIQDNGTSKTDEFESPYNKSGMDIGATKDNNENDGKKVAKDEEDDETAVVEKGDNKLDDKNTISHEGRDKCDFEEDEGKPKVDENRSMNVDNTMTTDKKDHQDVKVRGENSKNSEHKPIECSHGDIEKQNDVCCHVKNNIPCLEPEIPVTVRANDHTKRVDRVVHKTSRPSGLDELIKQEIQKAINNQSGLKPKNDCTMDMPVKTTTMKSINSSVHQESRCKVQLNYPGKISEQNLLLYLAQYLDSKTDYKVTSYSYADRATVATLVFGSRRKAQHAFHCVKKNNKDIGMKVKLLVGDTVADMTKEELNKLIQKEWSGLLNTAQSSLSKHEKKISDLKTQIANLNASKNLSLGEFNNQIEQKITLESKLNELICQKKEFSRFMDMTKTKLNGFPPRSEMRKLFGDVRVSFGLELLKLQAALPMYAKKSAIIESVKQHQVNIILGETGSGKSTQMTQYLVQAGFAENGLIACTQPRKVAAMTLAQYVSKEMGSHVGGLVGYHCGAQKKKSADTKIMYMTDHVLLNECIADPVLSKYSSIIVDEAHERSIFTDLLLGMIKKALPHRPDLRVLITSATIDPKVFEEYFDGCPVVKVSGRVFPVDVKYDSENGMPDEGTEATENYLGKAVQKAIDIHHLEPPGDILVFLTSPHECEKACEEFAKKTQRTGQYVCLPLHGQQQPNDQKRVFDKLARGQRKIVFATNCAETSITIPGIKYVLDTGLAKEKQFDVKKNMSTLTVCYISKSSADQRKGRAGRTDVGKCFRLYSEETYKNMRSIATPEILRAHLGQSLLKLMLLGIPDPTQFDFVEPPPHESMMAAKNNLEELGATDDNGLTDLGKKLANLSIEPRLGKLVLDGIDQGIGFEVVVLAGLGSVGFNIFFRGRTKEEQDKSDKTKIKLCHSRGDIFTYLMIYQQWYRLDEKDKNRWCMENSLNAKSLRMTREATNEMLNVLDRELKIKLKRVWSKESEVENLLPGLLLSCYRGNVCYFAGHRRAGYIPIRNPTVIFPVHPSSVLNSLRSEPKWILYEQILNTSQQFALNVTYIKEDEMQKQLDSGLIHFDEKQVENKMVNKVILPGVGPWISRQIAWKKHGNPRKAEENFRDVIQCENMTDKVVVDWEKEQCLIYTQPSHHGLLCHHLQSYITPLKEQLKLASHEFPIIENGQVRCHMVTGGSTRTILMPHHSRTVNVKQIPEDATNEEVIQYLSQYGEVEDYTLGNTSIENRPKNVSPAILGKVTFLDYEAASKVIKDHQEDSGFVIQTSFSKPNPTQNTQIRVKVEWCRRQSKGFAFVKFADPEAARLSLATIGDILIYGHRVAVQLNRKCEEELYLTRIPKDVANNMKEAVQDAIPYYRVTDVRVIREKPFPTSNQEVEMYSRRLTAQMGNLVNRKSFTVDLRKPKETDFTMNGIITFNDIQHASIVVDEADSINIEGNRVHMNLQLQIVEYVPKQVYGVFKSRINRALRDIEDQLHCEIQPVEMQNGTFRVRFLLTSLDEYARCKTLFNAAVAPVTYQLRELHHCRLFASAKGRYFLEKMMKGKNLFIQFDRWHGALLIYALPAVKTKTMQDIEKYLRESQTNGVHDFSLAGDGKPPGMLRELFVRYGISMEQFRIECGLDDVIVLIRDHVLRLQGDEESINKAKEIIERIEGELPDKKESNKNDCPVCFCPVEDDVYTTEYCGHNYCQGCMDGLIHHSITSKDFPIVCAKEDCKEPLVRQDIYNLLGQTREALEPLIIASTEDFVLKNKKYQYCITPDCPVVYRSSNSKHLFECPGCRTKICTHCKEKYHEGLSCQLYQGMKSDDAFSLRQWMKQNPENRYPCPRCSMVIEKNKGCMLMTCKCGAYICWRCKKEMPSSKAGYDHLGRCGGIFDQDPQ